jgi:hypothetical protein
MKLNCARSLASGLAIATVPATPAPTTAAGGSSCTACTVANNALPWLALIVDPSTVWDAITAVVSTLGVIIASFFGF